MTEFACKMSNRDMISARLAVENVVITTPENEFYLTPVDARAFAAEIAKLADEIGGTTTVATVLPNVLAAFDQRIAELADALAALADQVVEVDRGLEGHARRIGSLEAYQGAPKLRPLTGQYAPNEGVKTAQTRPMLHIPAFVENPLGL